MPYSSVFAPSNLSVPAPVLIARPAAPDPLASVEASLTVPPVPTSTVTSVVLVPRSSTGLIVAVPLVSPVAVSPVAVTVPGAFNVPAAVKLSAPTDRVVPCSATVPTSLSVRPLSVTFPRTPRTVPVAGARLPLPPRKSRVAGRSNEAVVFSVPFRVRSLSAFPSALLAAMVNVPPPKTTDPLNVFAPLSCSAPRPDLVSPVTPVIGVSIVVATPVSVVMLLIEALAPSISKAVPPNNPYPVVLNVMPASASTVSDKVTVPPVRPPNTAALVLSHTTPGVTSSSFTDQAVPPVFVQVPTPPRVASSPNQ